MQIKMCPGDRSLRSQTVRVASKVVLKIESKIFLVLYLRTLIGCGSCIFVKGVKIFQAFKNRSWHTLSYL